MMLQSRLDARVTHAHFTAGARRVIVTARRKQDQESLHGCGTSVVAVAWTNAGPAHVSTRVRSDSAVMLNVVAESIT